MHGAIPPLLLARVLLIMGWKCLLFATPFLVIAALWWLVNQTDRIINHLFPNLEWEHSLGWLNTKAERRANAALRWLGYAIYALLAAALPGMVWGTQGLQEIDNWSDPWVIGDLGLRILVLVFCLGVWVFYLGVWLIPKLRAEREEAELQKFRAEMKEVERERGEQPHSRLEPPLQKPRTNAAPAWPIPPAPLMPDRSKRKRSPGE